MQQISGNCPCVMCSRVGNGPSTKTFYVQVDIAQYCWYDLFLFIYFFCVALSQTKCLASDDDKVTLLWHIAFSDWLYVY